jgi:hypothetical protein
VLIDLKQPGFGSLTRFNNAFSSLIFIGRFALSILRNPAASVRRARPTVSTVAAELSIKQMFEEANGYNRKKFAEYEQKKIAYSEKLRLSTERAQRELAAKYATAAATRTNLSVKRSITSGCSTGSPRIMTARFCR